MSITIVFPEIKFLQTSMQSLCQVFAISTKATAASADNYRWGFSGKTLPVGGQDLQRGLRPTEKPPKQGFRPPIQGWHGNCIEYL